MWSFLELGGPIQWLLFGCSILFVAVFLERQIALHRCRVYLHDFLPGLLALIREHRFAEAAQICASTPGPVARVSKTLILQGRDMTRTDLRELADSSCNLELPHLERQMPLLAGICHLAPLLGLLGTFLGLLEAFSAASSTGGPLNTTLLTEGIYQALIAAASGIMIAIPAYAAFLYLSGRINRIAQEMQRAAFELINVLTVASDSARGIIEFNPKRSTSDRSE